MKNEDGPSMPRTLAGLPGVGKPKPPTRRLNLPSRVRKTLRRHFDRLLGAQAVWSLLLVVVVMLLLGGPWFGSGIEDLEVGQIAPRDIKTLEAFDYPDETETEKRRVDASASVPEVYVFYPSAAESLVNQLALLFRDGRAALEQSLLAEENPVQTAEARLRERVPEVPLQVLLAHRFDPDLEREIAAALTEVMAGRIVANRAALERDGVITLIPRGRSPQRVDEFSDFSELGSARRALCERLQARLELPPADESAICELGGSFLNTNVSFDREATAQARSEAALRIQPVYTKVERGELLVRKGQRLAADDVAKLGAARQASGRPHGPREWLGVLFLASMIAFFVFRYSAYHQRAFRKFPHLHAMLVLMMVAMLGMSEVVLWLVRRMTDNLDAPFNQIDVYPYLIPLGAGAIVVALLTNGRIATVYAAFFSLLFGATNNWNAYLAIWAMLVQCSGVYAISTYRARTALLRAGLVVGGAGAATVVALETLRGQIELLPEGLYGASLAFLGGALGVGLLISFSLPLLETMFNVLTDIRLLELSNVNTPLLSKFALKAPGSYNHSLVVGNLAEEAAKEIGANSLFCRVAAVYHDIGKMNKPEYFVENQRGVNPHDRLSPSMSALIIASHVKDGIKMAREAGLPEQIVDIIPQHHGTKLMTYFFEKAKKQADPALGPIEEADFRYPGPKPQTKEGAIFMLADAVEAAARTVDEPTANRLKEMIRKVTNSIVVSGQLEECDLTFADLNRIQEGFLRILVSMYHHRVDYPGFDFRKPKGDPPAAGGDGDKDNKTTPFRDRRVARNR